MLPQTTCPILRKQTLPRHPNYDTESSSYEARGEATTTRVDALLAGEMNVGRVGDAVLSLPPRARLIRRLDACHPFSPDGGNSITTCLRFLIF